MLERLESMRNSSCWWHWQLYLGRVRDFFVVAHHRFYNVAIKKIIPTSAVDASNIPELSHHSNDSYGYANGNGSGNANGNNGEMSYNKKSTKIKWYYAPAFLLFWLILIFAVVVPLFFKLPAGFSVEDEHKHPGEFIGEYAERALYEFDTIGPKVVGSYANENMTVQFLFNQLEKIRRVMHQDLFDMEVDRQIVSGAYIHWSMINMYQGLQNVVVRFKAKNATSESYLLINSHFDSKPGSPGSGDDGAMVVIMLEVLRVLATTRQTFAHPIIFLFNGAEENPLQASHGFITQHKWAKNCKALINLDSAGSGNREILFQSGPNHPWLMNYYRKYVKRPFATTFAEELFQAKLIPSDTDFRIFRDFGNVPGLDFAHSYNGYVYHTKYDRYNVIPRGTLQATGDNILALARAFANSPELEDPTPYAKGHTVFYDYLGLFFIYYTEAQGKIANTCIAVGALVLVGISLWLMASISYLSIGRILRLFGLIFVLHLVGFVLALGLPLLMAVLYDSSGRSLTWYTNKWLILGLYVCPTLFGLCAPTLLYLSLSRNDKVSLPFRLQMVLHAHTVVLAILCLLLTFLGIRSSYFLMISLFFYACSLILNLITTLYRRAFHWSLLLMLSQIMPFLYFTYLFHSLLCTLMPMMGRFGSSTNPDLYIAMLTALGILLSMGYLIPLLNIFSRPKSALLLLPIITFIFAMMSLTPVGFPYRPKTHSERINFLEVRRVFYEYDGSISRNESGYYFDFQDRRKHLPVASSVDLEGMHFLEEDCSIYMMCGVPVFNHRMSKKRAEGAWLPREEPLQLPSSKPELTLLRKQVDANTRTVRFEFELKGPPHMSIFIQPLEDVTVTDWSFIKDMLKDAHWKQPYHIYFSYGADNTTLSLFITLKKDDGKFDEPLMEFGVSGHYVSFEYARDAETKAFMRTFPSYTFIMEWPSSYERYIF